MTSADLDADYTAFVEARWPSLVRAGVLLGCTLDEAHDLAQTTLLRCYTKWSQVQRAENPHAYVYRMLVNCHRDSRKRRWWGERPTETLPESPVADGADEVGTTDAVRRALGDLSEVHRQVLVLRYFGHLTDDEVAHALRIPAGTVKSRISRALARLVDNPHLSDLAQERP